MYISKQHKFAYFASPRTASNSAQRFLEEGGIGHETDIIYNLDGIELDKDLDVPEPNLAAERYSYNAGKLLNYHMTPTQAIQKGLISLEELQEFNAFSFVRDPIERWISSIFVARDMGYWSGDPIEFMSRLCRTNNIESMKLVTDLSWDYKDYFFHEDQQVVKAYRIENMETVLNTLVNSCGGTPPDLKIINVSPIGTPDEYKRPVEEWMPWDCIEILRETLFHEFKFYYSVK